MFLKRPRETRRRLRRSGHSIVATLVIGGILASAGSNFLIEPPADHALPGVALGSQEVLAVQRTLTLLAAWLALLVVAAQALNGRLPTEISGRGLRYADAEKTQGTVGGIHEVLLSLGEEDKELRRHLARLDGKVKRQSAIMEALYDAERH